ncbi:hypothetical protein [Actinomadura sp. NPDC049753]|uniref:hypothetical protein n=1 Tax=Actinomadura sp. NPDC049753 TaxID=3154739 RepID=UPI003421C5C7
MQRRRHAVTEFEALAASKSYRRDGVKIGLPRPARGRRRDSGRSAVERGIEARGSGRKRFYRHGVRAIEICL